jgi:hypothetical protein
VPGDVVQGHSQGLQLPAALGVGGLQGEINGLRFIRSAGVEDHVQAQEHALVERRRLGRAAVHGRLNLGPQAGEAQPDQLVKVEVAAGHPVERVGDAGVVLPVIGGQPLLELGREGSTGLGRSRLAAPELEHLFDLPTLSRRQFTRRKALAQAPVVTVVAEADAGLLRRKADGGVGHPSGQQVAVLNRPENGRILGPQAHRLADRRMLMLVTAVGLREGPFDCEVGHG